MKNTAAAVVSIAIAICVGLGIPLASARIQDTAVSAATESMEQPEATLGLNGRGSVSLWQKYILVGIDDGMHSAELSEGKYMLADQAAEKAIEYAGMLAKFDIRCVDPESEDLVQSAPQPMLIVDDSRELPSIIVWSVKLTDENGSETFVIDDESAALLALSYYENDYTGWSNASPASPDISKLRAIAEQFAALIGADISSVAEAENIRPYYTEYIFIRAEFADGKVIGGDGGDERMSNALLLRICDKGYSFNNALYGGSYETEG